MVGVMEAKAAWLYPKLLLPIQGSRRTADEIESGGHCWEVDGAAIIENIESVFYQLKLKGLAHILLDQN